MTPQYQQPFSLPTKNPMFSNQGTGTNADGSAQVNLGSMTLAWMGAFQAMVALCLPTLISQVLTANFNVVPPPAANGQLLAVILLQDPPGSYAVTWDADGGTIVNAPTVVAMGLTLALFVGAGGYWWGLSPPGGAVSSPAPIVELLTGAYNVAPPAAVDGQVLLVRLTQDATGGRAVTWDSAGNTMNFPPEIIGAALDANMTTTAIFVASGGFWWGPAIGRQL